MAVPFEVHSYSIQTLKHILSTKSGALPSVVEGKLHTLYFENYFDDLGASVILVENDYVDRDFIEDYAGYYARCFGKYESLCTRLHFFDNSFTSRQFGYTLMDRGKTLPLKKLQESYLGFVVIKRLPKTFVGRTCLKTYGSDNGRRYYPTLRRYPVGLFGLGLSVNETLGFQEQDRGVAACATSALWTVFQGTGKLFQHAIPSPVEITRLATQIPDEAVPGILPSRGLTGRQEIHAIRQLGLEADYTNAQDEFSLMCSVYAYLRAGIPLLLNASLWDTSVQPTPKFLGWHAMAVTGFSLGRAGPVPHGDLKYSLRASRIDKIYVHDDQVGPFARMVLDGVKVHAKNGKQYRRLNSLSTSWCVADGKIGSVRAVPWFVIIPLYPKVRIRFDFIREVVMRFDQFILGAIPGSEPSPSSLFEWDIYLTAINQLKSEIRIEAGIIDSVRRKVLLSNMPRFIWRAKAMHNNQVVLELLFDATDIEQGKFFVCAIEYSKPLYTLLRLVAQNAYPNSFFHTKLYWRILEWFATKV